MKLSHALFLLFTTLSCQCYSQEIPIGTWRAHLSYNTIHDVVFGDNKVFAAAENGVMFFDRSDNSINSYNKVNGLSGSLITSIAYDDTQKKLLIAYADGMLDIVDESTITNFDRLKNSQTISGSKKLNAIEIHDGLAYIAADFGVVVFDIAHGEVKETWRDLGEVGSTIRINELAFRGDSIFLATEKGILAGDLNDNLLDFSLWKRFDDNEFNGSIDVIGSFNGKIFVGINESGIHRYENGDWVKESFLQDETFQSLTASTDHLIITQGPNIWTLNTSDVLEEVIIDQVVLPSIAREDSGGTLWVGDNTNGLITNLSGSFGLFILNGPSTSSTFRLNFAGEKLYAVRGGPSSTWTPLRHPGKLDMFGGGLWDTQEREVADIVDVDAPSADMFYVASFGYGVEEEDGGSSILYDEGTSSLININPPGRFVNVSAIERSPAGLWVANYGSTAPLHLLKNDGTWEPFSIPLTAARYPTNLTVDSFGYVWMIINPSQGGGIVVFDREENRSVYLTNVAGVGGLPSKSVRSIAVDRDGYVWIGTDEGVAYFIYSPDVFEVGIDAVKPIYENRFLLKDDRVTAVAVDGGNRKWMATERGVWLFDQTGETVIYNFTAENSPLLSDVVRDVAIVPTTGEVFFATDAGIISYRSGATASKESFESVKIFPNPITKEFSGTVGISGLATDAVVKITDISGKLVWQTQANGGTATWNVQDYKGRRATTGIYLVFAAKADGSERVVGKLAVVD
jgi:hypothetical protein